MSLTTSEKIREVGKRGAPLDPHQAGKIMASLDGFDIDKPAKDDLEKLLFELVSLAAPIMVDEVKMVMEMYSLDALAAYSWLADWHQRREGGEQP